ncbi:MAG: hypothetical protein R6V12_06475 [Candidatus Hydrogenedentota bacterium]
MPPSNNIASRFFSNYGMFFILVLLCAFFSFATLTETYPEGAEAAKAIVAQFEAIEGPVVTAVGGTDPRPLLPGN